jgi:penicillin-insensitive murein endopeptidase
MSLMRRLPIVFEVGSLVVGAGIIGAVMSYAPVSDLQTARLDTVTAHPAAEEDHSITALPQDVAGGSSQIQPQESTQNSRSVDSNELSLGSSASPEYAEPTASNDSPKEQTALELSAPRSPTQSIDEHPAASAESEFATLTHVAVPLPPERPSPEIIREQNLLAAPLFADVKLPSAGATRLVGFYSAGCMAGGQSLALQGPHWQVMRPSRNRYWGHSNLINFIERLAENVSKHTDWPGILVGDMAQPRGGPLPSGHASHQIGLDVDIWLHPMPAKPYTQVEADTVPMLSVVASDNKTLHSKFWQPADAAMIKMAAQDPNVERVFVNAVIKKELCRRKAASDDAWLPKVRPWYGHDDHMHVRLKCPADAPECREQDPIPDAEGCDKSLDQWLSKAHLAIEERLRTQPPSKRHVLMRDLPIACSAVLHDVATSRVATGGH